MTNRELDAWIAEKVMGFTRDHEDKYGEHPWKTAEGDRVYADFMSAPAAMKMPRYSTVIAAAWEVVEKLDLFGVKELPSFGAVCYYLSHPE